MKLKQKSFVAIPASLVFLFAILSLSSEFAPKNTSAVSPLSASLTVAVPETISLSLSKNVLNVSINPSGSFATLGSDYTVADVSTSNFTGYSLVLSDQDNNTNLVRIKTDLQEPDVNIPTIDTTNNPAYNVNTGLAPSDVRSNVWGYSVGTFENETATEGNYFGVPALSSPRNIKVTDTTAANDETPVFLGAKIDSTATAGSYSNVVVFSVVANYTPSSSNEITSITPNSISASGGDELTIDTNIDYQEGYADSTHPLNVTLINATDATDTSSCTGVTLSSYLDSNDNEKLRITCTTGEGLEADANYVIRLVFTKLGNLSYTSGDTIVAEASGFWGITYMQEMTTDVCNSVYTPSNATGNNVTIITDKNIYKTTVTADNQPYVPQRTLIDVRGKDGTGTMESPATGSNGATYIVRKLADGNCWMTQNLDLNLSTSVALTNETTDIGYGVNSSGYATGRSSWTPGYNTQTSSSTSWNQYGTDGARSYDSGEIWWNGDTSTTTTKPSDATQAGTYHLGNYYNWNAATAGSGYNGSTHIYTSGNQYAADSICPKGWKLPLELNDTAINGSFNYLIRNKYGIAATNSDASVIREPMSFIRSGIYDYSGGGVYYQGSYGYFWSSTVSSSNYARVLYFYSSSLSPLSSDYKGNGFPIRCLNR